MASKEIIKIEDIYLAYTILDKPVKNKFDDSGLTREFSTTVILSKAKAKEFKALKLNKTIQEIDTSDFEAKYKFAPPYPEQEEQYLFKATNKATYKDGKLKPDWTFPRVYFEKGGTRVENPTVKIGNGSLADIRFEANYNEKTNATSISIHSVLVKEHVEYVQRGDEWASSATEVVQRPSFQEENTQPSNHNSYEEKVPKFDIIDDDEPPF